MKSFLFAAIALSISSIAHAGDVTAKCQAFISDAQQFDSGQENGGNIFGFTVKINRQLLDGDVVKVVQHFGTIGDVAGWSDSELSKNDNGDYEGDFVITNNFRSPRLQEYTDVIFVETNRGTHYWIRSAKDGGNFFFTLDLMNHIRGEKNVVMSYLNPNSCR